MVFLFAACPADSILLLFGKKIILLERSQNEFTDWKINFANDGILGKVY